MSAKHAPELLDALVRLCNEVEGLAVFELEVAGVISNTNYAVLMDRLSKARAAIAKATGETP
jgi:hypothetical protein